MALDTTGKAFALRGTRNVDELACFKYIYADGITDIVFGRICKAHFANVLDRRNTSLVEMAFQRFVDFVLLDGAKAELNSIVAIGLNRLVLNDDVIAGFDDCNGDDFTFFGEDLRHTEFST